MFRLKALRPEKYRDRQEVEIRGVLANLDMTKLPDNLVARIAAGEPAHAVLAGAIAAGLDARSFLQEPLRLPAASAEDGVAEAGDAGPPHPVDRATGDD